MNHNGSIFFLFRCGCDFCYWCGEDLDLYNTIHDCKKRPPTKRILEDFFNLPKGSL